jgi:hypothetical protein
VNRGGTSQGRAEWYGRGLSLFVKYRSYLASMVELIELN